MGDRYELAEETRPGSADSGSSVPGAGVWLLLAGIAVSCTGIGAILGVPLIALGLALPVMRRHRPARRLAPAAREAGTAPPPLSPPRR